mmetsp:Transcript_33991/g.62131  ORF Transcript_33991/g.62131 Transcript_33991/m.62131 type:complete len:82 (-) Transcript_33991:32-277(-)
MIVNISGYGGMTTNYNAKNVLKRNFTSTKILFLTCRSVRFLTEQSLNNLSSSTNLCKESRAHDTTLQSSSSRFVNLMIIDS